jgi:hypothetical protein
MTDDSEIVNRNFIAIATDRYEANGTFAALDVNQEVERIRAWLSDAALGERRFGTAEEYAGLACRPSRDDILQAIVKKRQFSDADAVVVYVTGHGITGADRDHLIVLHDTDPDNPTVDALPTRHLIQWLANPKASPDQAMIIIDACQAGQVADNLPASVWQDLPDTWFVLLTSAATADAKLGAFSGAVDRFVADLRTTVDHVTAAEPYLEPYRFYKAVAKLLKDGHGQSLRPLTLPSDPSVCLPNPGYVPPVVDRVVTDPARRDLAVLQQDMSAHWALRAPVMAGVAPVFGGRGRVMRALIDVTAGPVGTLVLSGRAGSGKSSVLARLVTCSDPGFRAEFADRLALAVPVPPEGAVDVAVLATGKTAEQIARQLGQALGATQPGPDAASAVEGWVAGVRAAVAQRDRPVTVVVDALDEAADPHAVLRTVLAEISPRERPLLRLLIGVRSSGGDGLADGTGRDLATVATALLGGRRIAVDADEWWDPQDLRSFVAQALAQPESPYDATRIPAVAAAVERAAGRSYLVAGLAARKLAGLPVAFSADDPGLTALLAKGSAQLVADDLDASVPDPEDRVRAATLLRACALAEGRGVPARTIWPVIASAVATDASFGDSDVRWLLEHRLSGYLVRDLEDGLTVYRPFHDELRRVLAAGDGSPGVPDHIEAQRRIALSLRAFATWGPE